MGSEAYFFQKESLSRSDLEGRIWDSLESHIENLGVLLCDDNLNGGG